MKYRLFSRHKQRWKNVTRLMSRDGQSCQICQEPLSRKVKEPADPRYITFDHIVPRSAGGGDLLDNLRLAHRRCNELRGNDPLAEDDEENDDRRTNPAAWSRRDLFQGA